MNMTQIIICYRSGKYQKDENTTTHEYCGKYPKDRKVTPHEYGSKYMKDEKSTKHDSWTNQHDMI